MPGLSVTATTTGPRTPSSCSCVVRPPVGGGRTPADLDRVAAVCRGLDGMALAIELAAARLPALGLDGLEAGLVDRLDLLAGGSRVDGRHRSLRVGAGLELRPAGASPSGHCCAGLGGRRALLGVGGRARCWGTGTRLAADQVPALLARLADESLLVPTPTALADALRHARDHPAVRRRPARRRGRDGCRARPPPALVPGGGRAAGRAGPRPVRTVTPGGPGSTRCPSRCAAACPGRGTSPSSRTTAYRLSLLTAGLSLLRGRPGEAQRRFELAAELAPDDSARTFALRQAAGAADGRQFGNEALRLREMAADAALRAGDRAGAAMDLARAAELVGRGPGIMAVAPPAGEARAAPVAGASVGRGPAGRQSRDPDGRGVRPRRARPAGERPRRPSPGCWPSGRGDPLAESAALDALTSIQLASGRLREALDSSVRRTELLASVPVTAESALEFFDAYQMGSQCALAAGDLGEACRLGEGLLDLPFYREEYHLGTSRLIVVGLLAGTWDEAMASPSCSAPGGSGPHDHGRATCASPRTPPRRSAPCGATTPLARSGWRWSDAGLAGDRPGSSVRPRGPRPFGEFFDAMVLLHRGLAAEAVALLAEPPESLVGDLGGCGGPGTPASWAEAGVLGRSPGAGGPPAAGPVDDGRQPDRRGRGASGLGAAQLAADGRGRGHDDLVAAASTLRSLGAPLPVGAHPGDARRGAIASVASPSWPRWGPPLWPGLQDDVERRAGGHPHVDEPGLAQHLAHPHRPGLGAEPEGDLLRERGRGADHGRQAVVDRARPG